MATLTETPFLHLDRPPTAQEVFDFAVGAFFAMPHRAMGKKGFCQYRTGDPSCPACIAGQLLTDAEVLIPEAKQKENFPQYNDGENYYPLEGVTTFDQYDDPGFDNLAGYDLIPDRLKGHVGLIQALQFIHDPEQNWFDNKKRMVSELLTLAKGEGLDPSIVEKVFTNADR